MANPAGESESGALRLDFDRRLICSFAAPSSPLMRDCLPIANLTMRLD